MTKHAKYCIVYFLHYIHVLFVIGQNKMVINHLDKLFVTNDAATIIRELEVSPKFMQL